MSTKQFTITSLNDKLFEQKVKEYTEKSVDERVGLDQALGLTLKHQITSIEDGEQVVKKVNKFKITILVRTTDSGENLIISEKQIRNLQSITEGSLISNRYEGFHEKLKQHVVQEQKTTFQMEVKQPIPYPYSSACAAGIILTFFNSSEDPYEKIQTIADYLKYPPEHILITYYLSCISYILKLSLNDSLTEEEGFIPLIDESSIMKDAYRGRYLDIEKESDISAIDVCFHALYGAYTFCRAVTTKQDFNKWITGRYNALRSSLQLEQIKNPKLALQKGGAKSNEIASSRTCLKSVVLAAIRKDDLDDPRALAVRSHIKLLTQLSEMTTYSMINKVIAAGGPILALEPIKKQLSKYANERDQVYTQLTSMGLDTSEIVYLTLIKPRDPHFISGDYPDLIVAAQALEKVKDPKSTTIDAYKAKTDNASILLKTALQFYQLSTTSECQISEPTKEEKESLAKLGVNIDPLVKEAKKILDILRKQNA